MPELPEVEVTRRQLEPLLVGRRVVRVFTTAPSYFFLTPPASLQRRLRGRRFEALDRTGKYLLARLDNGERLLLHLGMTGQIFGSGTSSVRLLASTRGAALTPEAQKAAFRPDKHTHLRLSFDDGGPDVLFRDARKFGKVQLMRVSEPSARLDRLGPDALGATGRALHAAVRRRRVPIKSLLLDQSLLAGVGNIYADEALSLAGVRPTRPGRRVSAEECDRIARAIRHAWRTRHGVYRLTLPDGRRLSAPVGQTMLETLRVAGVPHASVCGGRGRCTTCRVHVGAAARQLPAQGRAHFPVRVVPRDSHGCANRSRPARAGRWR